jgi:glycosyltransferase involved in cell wall biosynthesis
MGWTPRGYLSWIGANAGAFDVVVLHDLYSVLSVGAARAATRAGVPYVLQPFGSVAPVAERGKPQLKRAFLALWGRRTLREAAASIHSTQHERADLIAAGAPPQTLVDLPLPLDLPPASGEPLAADPTLAFLGRLDPIKGIERLLESVALARRSLPALSLEVLGPAGTHGPRYEALAGRLGLGSAARFRGFVDAEEKVRALERAHAMCLLSHSEGLPLAALEAMGCGTPVVLSRGCHLDEVDGRAGVVVSGDPPETARAIVALLRDEERRARLADGARAFAETFRRDRVMPAMIELLARLAGTPTASRRCLA